MKHTTTLIALAFVAAAYAPPPARAGNPELQALKEKYVTGLTDLRDTQTRAGALDAAVQTDAELRRVTGSAPRPEDIAAALVGGRWGCVVGAMDAGRVFTFRKGGAVACNMPTRFKGWEVDGDTVVLGNEGGPPMRFRVLAGGRGMVASDGAAVVFFEQVPTPDK